MKRDSFSFIIPIPLSNATHTNTQSTPGFWQLLCVCPLIDEPYSKCFFLQISGSLSASCMLIPNKTLGGAVPLLTPSLLISSLMSRWLHMTRGHMADMKMEGRHRLRLIILCTCCFEIYTGVSVFGQWLWVRLEHSALHLWNHSVAILQHERPGHLLTGSRWKGDDGWLWLSFVVNRMYTATATLMPLSYTDQPQH